MVVHKRIAKALIKKVPKVAVAGLPPAAYYPYVALGVTLGNLVTNLTRPHWEKPVSQSGFEMGTEVRKMFDMLALPLTYEQIDPESPWRIPEGHEETPRAPTKPKRKVSKANKATKRAYAYLAKLEKGKMTRKKCRALLKKAAKMASKANPNTKSRIGKRITKMLKECGKIRRDIWGTNKRY